MPHLFLTGYEKESIEEFIQKLHNANITTVIDVREIPLSRKSGFSKINLEKTLREEGIDYFHFQEMGSPSSIRNQLRKDGDYLKFFIEYRMYAKRKIHILKSISEIIKSREHSALMCFEKDCELCHRSIIASELLKL